jgi:hypothetical protein
VTGTNKTGRVKADVLLVSDDHPPALAFCYKKQQLNEKSLYYYMKTVNNRKSDLKMK